MSKTSAPVPEFDPSLAGPRKETSGVGLTPAKFHSHWRVYRFMAPGIAYLACKTTELILVPLFFPSFFFSVCTVTEKSLEKQVLLKNDWR